MTTFTRSEFAGICDSIAENAALVDSIFASDAPHSSIDVLEGLTRHEIVILEEALAEAADSIRLRIAALDTAKPRTMASAAHSTKPTPSSVSSCWYLHDAHRAKAHDIRRQAERELLRRHARGNPQIIANVVAAHRDEYDAIVREIVASA